MFFIGSFDLAKPEVFRSRLELRVRIAIILACVPLVVAASRLLYVYVGCGMARPVGGKILGRKRERRRVDHITGCTS
jgi:hypothetical protein